MGLSIFPIEVEASIQYSARRQIMSWMGQEITEEQCQTIYDYFTEYHDDQWEEAIDEQTRLLFWLF